MDLVRDSGISCENVVIAFKSILHLMLQNNVAPNIVKLYQWSIILGAGFYTTCPGERVLVVIRFNATFLPLRPYCKKLCTSFFNDAESLTTDGCAL